MVRVNDSPTMSCYCVSLFSLHGEEHSFGVPPFNVLWWSIHTLNAASKVRVNSCREISNESVIIGDSTKSYIVFELGDVFTEGQGFRDSSSAEPGDGFIFGVRDFKCFFEILPEICDGSKAFGFSLFFFVKHILVACGGPSSGGAFGKEGQGESNFSTFSIVYQTIDHEVGFNCFGPFLCLGGGSIESFGSSKTNFKGFL